MKKKSNYHLQNKEDSYKINDHITARDLRLVGDNIENGIYSIQEALAIAQDLGLDLVEINPKLDPPVCKVLDYKKFLYEQKKKKKQLKSKQTKVIVKEIRFGPQTNEHDYEFKKKNARKFLKEGSKVKTLVFFKGRSVIYKDQGEILLLRLARDLEDCAKVEQMPYMEGKRMFLILIPKKIK